VTRPDTTHREVDLAAPAGTRNPAFPRAPSTLGYDPAHADGALTPPIHLTSTYVFGERRARCGIVRRHARRLHLWPVELKGGVTKAAR